MVKIKLIKTKEGEIYKTQEGVELKTYVFEDGDIFIPLFNSVNEKTKERLVNGKKTSITDHTLKVNLKDKNGKSFEEIFINLTPTQAKSLNKKIEEGLYLNQNLFRVYIYVSEKYGEQIGVGLKSNKKAKSFSDFESD